MWGEVEINTKVFYKLLVSLWVCVVRNAPKQVYNIFVISQGKYEG